MEITRTSMFTGINRTIDLPVTQDQMDAFNNGAHVQTAFPHLPVSDREFILTGVTQEEWDKYCPEEE